MNGRVFIYLRHFQNCIGHIRMASIMRRANSTYSWSRFCTLNWQSSASNYKFSHIYSGVQTVDLRVGRLVHTNVFKNLFLKIKFECCWFEEIFLGNRFVRLLLPQYRISSHLCILFYYSANALTWLINYLVKYSLGRGFAALD